MQAEIIIRASSLSGYPDCPRRAAARMFRDEILRTGHDLRNLVPSVGAAIGSSVHAAAEVILDEKRTTGVLAPIDVATDVAFEKYRVQVADGVNFDRETPAANVAETQIVRMARSYQNEIAPDINPILVEERLEAEVAPGLVLSGQQDVLAREPGKLRDLKTGKSRGNHRPQIGAYSLLAKSHGYIVTAACEDFIPRVAVKKPQPPAQSFEHALAGAERAAIAIMRTIEADLKRFRTGDPSSDLLPGDPWAFPANPTSKLCSAKWCPAWGTSWCTEHQRDDDDE